MKLPRSIKGTELAKHLCKHWAYEHSHQTGSHIILFTKLPTPKRISIPAHRPLRLGTFSAILDEVAEHKAVDVEQILRYL